MYEQILTEALRAPSAHNAQPWRLTELEPGRYELHYDNADYLPHDPDDRDAWLCMGAFVETLALAAVRHGFAADVTPVFTTTGADLHVVDVHLREAHADLATRRLAQMAADRHTNRSAYTSEPLTPQLSTELERLGCVLADPRDMARLVHRASGLSWADRRFVADLEHFCVAEGAEVGMTRTSLVVKRWEWVALHGAFRLGRLPHAIGRLFADRDVRLLRSAPAVAVLGADSLDARGLFDAGRRLLRAWSVICGAGFAVHPISISIDRPETAPEVAAISGIPVPAAVFRIGRPRRQVPRSGRRTLASVMVDRAPRAAAAS